MEGGVEPMNPSLEGVLMVPINSDELSKVLLSSKESSPGWDGVMLKDLKNNFIKTKWLLNAAMWLCDVPREWVKGRTTLIPKVAEPSEAGHYRPITVTPEIMRIFTKIIARRMADWAPLPMEQRGFKKEEGCAANLLLLQDFIKQARTQCHGLQVALIDFNPSRSATPYGMTDTLVCNIWGCSRSKLFFSKNFNKKSMHAIYLKILGYLEEYSPFMLLCSSSLPRSLVDELRSAKSK